MDKRIAIMIAVMVLFTIPLAVGEGGPLDGISKSGSMANDDHVEKESAPPAPPPQQASAPDPGFAEPDPGFGTFDWAEPDGFAEVTVPSAPRPRRAPPSRSAPPGTGELSAERLNLEI
ncbi:hypothetical protein [Qipengyuania nanhaisediminis]|uniref:hypothetical protein n=1 Tax=Qipengyuania nanhaisediminis TaxID=604088 RepID=UPI0038B3BF21